MLLEHIVGDAFPAVHYAFLSEVDHDAEATVEKNFGDRPPDRPENQGSDGVCLVLYCSPLDKAAIFGVERLPRIGV